MYGSLRASQVESSICCPHLRQVNLILGPATASLDKFHKTHRYPPHRVPAPRVKRYKTSRIYFCRQCGVIVGLNGTKIRLEILVFAAISSKVRPAVSLRVFKKEPVISLSAVNSARISGVSTTPLGLELLGSGLAPHRLVEGTLCRPCARFDLAGGFFPGEDWVDGAYRLGIETTA